jgi:hypothetical protein
MNSAAVGTGAMAWRPATEAMAYWVSKVKERRFRFASGEECSRYVAPERCRDGWTYILDYWSKCEPIEPCLGQVVVQI